MARCARVGIWVLLALTTVWVCAAEEQADAPAEQTGYGPRSEEERLVAEQIEQEDQLQRAKDGELQLTILEGKVYLAQDLDPNALPWVVGRFVSGGRVYGLILGNAELLDMLRPVNGKASRFAGRVRCNGKYYIIASLYQSLSVSSSRPKRGGM